MSAHKRTPLLRRLAPLAALAALAAGCHESDPPMDTMEVDGPLNPATFSIDIQADRVAATPDLPFQLEAAISGAGSSMVEFDWDLGDGSTATGQTVEVSYADAGTYAVELTARKVATGEQQAAAKLLVVFDVDAPQGLSGEPLPALPGDVDGDGELALRDGQLLRQHLAGLAPLVDAAAIERADFDLDGEISELDSALASAAILEGASVPRHLEPAAGQPGRFVTLFSPALLDPDASVLVVAGLSAPIQPPRLVLGQVGFLMPLDVLSPGAFTTAGGTAQVRLLVDGVEADVFDFEVEDPDSVPKNALAEVEELLTRAADVRTMARADLDAFLATSLAADLGFTSDGATVLTTMLDLVSAELSELEADHLAFLAQLGDEAREALARIANANGIDEALSAIDEALAQASTSAVATASDLDLLCKATLAAEVLGAIDSAAGYTCGGLIALFFISVIIPFDGILGDTAALFAAAVTCAQYQTLLEIPNFVFDLLPKAGNKLFLDASPSLSPGPGESVSLTPSLQLLGITNLCSAAHTLSSGVPGFSDGVQGFLAKKITFKILKSGPLFPVFVAIKNVSKATTEKFVMIVSSAVSSIISTTGAPQALQDLAIALCDDLGVQGSKVPIDAGLVSVTLTPDSGVLTPGSGTTPIVYTCPTDPMSILAQGVVVEASLPLCTGAPSGAVTVHCGATQDVMITMGDNGSLLDDIFEVVVDGSSVLTSSQPVVSTSTTIQLAPGDHSLQMKGLAAPDGVGTYFISVTGGTLTGGPPLSGSDLVAGAVFSWNLVVN